MQDWLPESDFVHLVLDAVEQMDRKRCSQGTGLA
jgi:hypothetical protein